MGDRGNFGIEHGEGVVLYLYAHWGGSELLPVVADIIEATTPRHTDLAYMQAWATAAWVARFGYSGEREQEPPMRLADPTTWRGDLLGVGLSVGQPPDNEHAIPIFRLVPDGLEGTGARHPLSTGLRALVEYQGHHYSADDFVAGVRAGLISEQVESW